MATVAPIVATAPTPKVLDSRARLEKVEVAARPLPEAEEHLSWSSESSAVSDEEEPTNVHVPSGRDMLTFSQIVKELLVVAPESARKTHSDFRKRMTEVGLRK